MRSFSTYNAIFVCLTDSGLEFNKFKSSAPKPMEMYNQGYEYIAYQTDVFTQEKGGKLMLPEIHDICHVYIDGIYTKTLERYSTANKEG